MFIVGTRVRTSLMNIVYKKSLRLSTTARRMATVGEMTNLIAVNAQSFAELTTYLNIIWSAPFQITICIIGLWRYLGVSCLFGVGTMVFFIPLNLTIANKSKQLQLTKLKYQDSRIKMMNEIFAGIKVIKLYGWELSFQNIVNRIRTDELSYLKKMGYLNMVSSFLWMCAPLIVSIVSFGTFVLIDSNNVLDANTAFVSISLFNILRFPLTVLPGVIAALINAMVSLSRIRNFLLRDEIKQDDITYDETPGVAISLNNVDLGWDAKSAEVNLKNLDLQIDQGKLVAVVGQVGCGKSSLISGILGEMHKLNDGKINLNGSSAYVAQQAWIQNATVRDNILFGKDYNQKLYEKVIESCSLKTDFQIMPAGDSTEIGEKGINLSGGQKQRISLARSVYVNADIYLLDDPLSAVDAHVGKDIFDNIIGPNGLLKDKTRVFVTNSLSFLPQVDEIILLENGQIVEKGTYEQLKNKNGAFTDFIRLYLQSQDFNKNNQQINEELGEKTPEQKRPATGQSIDILARQQSNKSKVEASVEKVVEKAGEKIIVKEKIESGEVKLSILKAYFKACGYVLTGLSVILFSIVNIGSIGSNVWLSEWSNDAKNPSLASDNKMYRLIVYAALGFAQCGITLLSDYFFVLMFLRASQSLHLRMLESILRSTIEFFESTPSGRIINRFSKDVDAIEKSIPESFKSLFRCFFHVLFTILVISASTPLFLAALVPIIVIYVFVQRYFVSSMRQLKRLESASKSPIFSHFTETQTGVSTIRAYRVQNRFINTMESRINENLIYYFPNNISNRWLALRLELIGNLITVFAALFAVIARDSISAGIAGLSISYSLNVSQTLNWLVRMSADFETNITSAERIEEYCNTPHENEWSIKETKPSLEWPQNGEIKIENYSVKYRDNLDNVLNDMNAQIKPGEKIGIVGRTGAGKSSLTLSLFRILENSVGKIIIDGVDIKSIGLHDLRHKLTIIPQEPVLFSGTLLMNLDPLQTYKDETKIWLALEHAHLKHFVLGLDKQLNFECTEGGENLSVGQRQLICLARALLRKTKILILDEATAAIDHNTDELIQKTIRESFTHCTVLTIAHRLNTILDSTKYMRISFI